MRQGLILAAGRGVRLKEHTADRPKCMVEVCGRPILDWAIDSLNARGITQITAVGGYCADKLPQDRLRVITNLRWAETNMVSTLRCASDILHAAPTVVSYGDILYHPDIVAALLDTPGDIVLTYDRWWRPLWESRFERPLEDAESFCESDGQLLEIGARASSLDDIQGQFMGLLKLSPAGWAQIEAFLSRLPVHEVDKLDTTSLLARLLSDGVRIATVGIEGRWCEIDGPSDLALAEQRCATPHTWTHDWRESAW